LCVSRSNFSPRVLNFMLKVHEVTQTKHSHSGLSCDEALTIALTFLIQSIHINAELKQPQT
jgi:hypothetical protein